MSDYTFTDMAVDYSVDELDDLTDRKIQGEGIDGDRMARIIRARRGTAWVTGQEDPYPFEGTVQDTARALWGSDLGTDAGSPVGNRRMAAVGGTGGHGLIEATHAVTGQTSGLPRTFSYTL